ncbi:hypothetical protein WOC76_04445 [Methylocystis sp. IM3]|jgi:hypothetical protein|uniref:hypothetical protein n=1 Tax=unclassified Methylocystis TaxID=2625913 RepID=UPI0030F65103
MSNVGEKILHAPSRAKCLEGLEDHVRITARLARAIYVAVSNENIFIDERDHLAVLELADSLADHASAALHVLYTKDGNK